MKLGLLGSAPLNGSGLQETRLKKLLKYAYIVSPVILSSISAALISYPQSTSCLIGTSLWSVDWKGKKFKCGLLGFCAMCWCWLNWTAEALQYNPCWRWPRRAWGKEILPIGKFTSSASDYLLCLERERARDINLEELIIVAKAWLDIQEEYWRTDEMRIWERICG